MRKHIIGDDDHEADEQWFDLDKLAQAAITSEDERHPIECALTRDGAGWRASRDGEQFIRLLFDAPLTIRRIRLAFEERDARTQEFVLRWSPDFGRSHQEVVRQQYTFSPGTTREVEDYTVDLKDVTRLELRITPDIRGGPARASLKQLRLG